MGKNVQRTITMSEEIWVYIDEISSVMTRTPSQQIEHIITALRRQRDAGDAEALRLATTHNPPQKPQQ